MRKFTTIASALMLGVMGFTANAQTPNAPVGSVPTTYPYSTATYVISPEPGTYTEDPFNWGMTPITIAWEDNSVALPEGETSVTVNVLVNGKEQTTTGVVDGSVLSITPISGDTFANTVQYTLPKNSVLLGSEQAYTNTEITFTYNELVASLILDPVKDSSMFSISTFDIYLADMAGEEVIEGAVLGINSKLSNILSYQYGEDVMNLGDPVVIENKYIKANANGGLTVTLPKALTAQGIYKFTVTNLPGITVTYNGATGPYAGDDALGVYYVSPYLVAPQAENFAGAFSPVTSVYVYVDKSSTIETALFEELVEVTYNGKSYPVSAINTTTYNGYPALQYVLKNPIYYVEDADPQSVYVKIPESGVKINGKTIYETISWTFALYPGATVTAESNSNQYTIKDVTYLYDLSGVNLNWSNYNISINEGVTPYVTFNGQQYPLTEDDVVDFGTVVVGEDPRGGNIVAPQLQIRFEEPYTAPGVYTVTFPAGYLTVGVPAADSLLSPEVTAQFTVVGPMSYNLVPEDGADLQEIENIVITFDSANTVEFDGSVTLYNTFTKTTYYGYLVDDNAPEFTFALSTVNPATLDEDDDLPAFVTVSNLGIYELTMTGFSETMTLGGVKGNVFNQLPIEATYVIVNEGLITTVPADGSTVPSIEEIVVNLNAENLAMDVEYYAKNPITLVNTATGDTWYCYHPYAGTPLHAYATYTLAFTDKGGALTSVFDQVGNYVLTIPGIQSGANTLPDQLFYYSVVPEGFATFNPAADSTVESLSQVVVTFSQKVAMNNDVRPAPVTLQNLNTGDVWYGMNPIQNTKYEGEGSQYTIDFYEDITGETPVTVDLTGDYELAIRGLYVVTNTEDVIENDADEVQVQLPVVTALYHLLSAADYLLTPASGTTVENLNNLSIAFVDAVEFEENYMPASAMLENRTTGDVYFCYYPTAVKAADVPEGYKVAYTFVWKDINGNVVSNVDLLGAYHLTLMGMTYNGQELPYITADYLIQPDFESLYVFSPEEGEVQQLETVTLTVVGQPNVGIYEVRPAPVVLENQETGTVYYCESPLKTRGEDGSSIFTIYFTELGSVNEVIVLEEGEWTLSVRGLYYSVINADESETDIDLPNASATYYVVNGTSGIESILGADSFDVYSINGMQLVKNGKADDVKALNQGLYIINGKKVIVRK